MKKAFGVLTLAVLLAAFSGAVPSLCAQEQEKAGMDPEAAKKLEEYITGEIDRMEHSLKLELWQVFYVDSILHHDYAALQEDLNGLRASKVSNIDIYNATKDKWAEQIYQSLHKILSEEQWSRYLKSGAEKERRSREKRKARMQKASKK